MSHRITIIFFLLILSIDAQSQQQIGQWQSFTDMKSVRGAVRVGSSIWTATSGGVFVFDTVSEQYKKFNHSNGLSSNDIRCIAVEPGNRIWVGGANGFINTYDLQTGVWSTINANRPNDDSQIGVQDFFLMRDTMFVATVFGVIPFKIGKWEFGDTYASFGFLSAPVVKCVLTDENHMFVGTDKGLAVAPLTAPNLSAPNSWTLYTTFPGLSSNSITAMTIVRDTLLFATDNGIGYYVNGSFGVVASLVGKSINDLLRSDDGKLLVLRNEGSGFIVESLSSLSEAPQVVDSNSSVHGSSFVPASSLWIGTTSSGLTQPTASGWNYYYPNGPKSNLFSSLAVDDDGVLWVASGTNVNDGFYRYNPSLPENVQWKIFPGYGSYKVSIGTKGSVWVSTWGDGVVEIVGDTIRRKLDYYSTVRLPSAVSNDSDFVVTGGVSVDNDDKVWIINRNEVSGRSLLRLNDDGTASYFDNQFPGYTSDGWFHSMVIDHNGTKWLAGDLPWNSKSGPNKQNGVYLFNENLVLSGISLYGTASNGYWGHLSSEEGLKSNEVLAFIVDLEGAVWIGTSRGVTIVSDPQRPKEQTPCFALQAYAPPYIQTMAVDALNNKWIGTNDGVFVVNSDGTQLLQTYNVALTNGQLLANDVRSIAIDQKRGIAYFGTEQGLSSLAIEPVQTNKSYSRLEVGPNPFILPNDQPLTIRNLVAVSTIKIMTVSGFVVTQFEAQGAGRAFWNGRDTDGAFVSSGIYFIVAFAENGSQTVTGKVAVIRR